MTTSLPQVKLRAIEPEDLDLLYRIENDRKLWNIGTSNVPYSRYALHDYVAHASSDIYTDRQVRMIIETTEGENVGIVDLVDFDPSNRRAEVGLIILNDYRRQGYGSSVLSVIADYAVSALHLHQLFAFIDTSNEASVRLFKRMHYQASSVIKDWLYDGREYRDVVMLQRVF